MPTPHSLAAVALVSLLAACAGPRASAPAAKATAAAEAPAAQAAVEKAVPAPASAVVSIPVSGMHCGNCVRRVTNALLAVDGVASADTRLSEQRAVVTYAPDRVKPEALVQAIRAAGYEPGAPVVQ